MIPEFFEITLRVLAKLDAERFDYMIVGSIASTIYGEPRLTHNVDIVIEIPLNRVDDIAALFGTGDFYCPPNEVIRSEIVRLGQFNIIDHESGMKVDFIVRKRNDHAKVEFSRRRQEPINQDLNVWIASPEDVIIKKLSFFRDGGSEKHLRDIRGILSQEPVDQPYILAWVEKLSLQKQWALVE